MYNDSYSVSCLCLNPIYLLLRIVVFQNCSVPATSVRVKQQTNKIPQDSKAETLGTFNSFCCQHTNLVVTRLPGESYRGSLKSLLLCLCDVFPALINSLVCSFCTSALGLVMFQIFFTCEVTNCVSP